MNRNNRILLGQVALVAGVCLFLFFFHLGAFGLVGADEPRYAQIAREMFGRHDWIVPTLNGSPWLEKPIFLYWKMMISYAVFGVSDWAARVPGAFHALALVVAMYFFVRRCRPGKEVIAALITASSAAIIGFGRGASTDILLSCQLALALLSWWTWHETGRKLWLAFFYLLLAFGALSKGPVAPGLALLIVGAYAALRRDGKIFVRSLWAPGFALFFLVAAPWYVAVQMKVPQFFRVFFLQHNLERFATNEYRHSQPFWYYLPVFLLSMLPWTVFTIRAIVEAIQSKVWAARVDALDSGEESGDAKGDKESGLDRRLHLFLVLWILIPIAFFSISRSKLPGYILPSIPAAALLTADYLPDRRKPAARWILGLHSVLCGGLVGAALLTPSLMLKVRLTSAVFTAGLIGLGVTLVLLFLLLRPEGIRMLPIATLAPVIAVVGFLLGPAAAVMDNVNSARPIDAQLRSLGVSEEPVAVFDVKRQIEYGLNFYCNRPIPRYERDGIPQGDHIVVAREGSEAAVQAVAGGRQVRFLSTLPTQHLDLYSVSK